MAQYISKPALVAEIDRLENKLYYEPENFKDVGAKIALDCLKSFLDTLEVKEVDLEKEYEEFVVDDPIFGNFITNDTMGMEMAKHFFELGLKAKEE